MSCVKIASVCNINFICIECIDSFSRISIVLDSSRFLSVSFSRAHTNMYVYFIIYIQHWIQSVYEVAYFYAWYNVSNSMFRSQLLCHRYQFPYFLIYPKNFTMWNKFCACSSATYFIIQIHLITRKERHHNVIHMYDNVWSKFVINSWNWRNNFIVR